MMHPLLLEPVYRRYLWGGRRFATALGRDLPPGDDFAESWELVDRLGQGGGDQSVVAAGPLTGRALGDLVRSHGRALLGRHSGLSTFPLLFKFLDACRDLSVQVHPDDERAARLVPPDRGKTEAWYVIDAEPRSRIYAGLAPGVGRRELAAAIRAGTCDTVLHSFEPHPGDCIFIPAGTVHAIGAGLLIAEIQQSSDVTYRLFDWNRTGPDGMPRPLHVDAGVEAVSRFGPVAPVRPQDTPDPAVKRLVTSEFFLFDEVRPIGAWEVGGDDTCHFLAVLDGTLAFDDHWSLPPAGRGRTVLMPAAIGRQRLRILGDTPATLLHVALP
ncbi:MAG: type I phosphomannose isomerase catalytic subunit [Planctomycetia bacterium]